MAAHPAVQLMLINNKHRLRMNPVQQMMSCSDELSKIQYHLLFSERQILFNLADFPKHFCCAL